MATDLDPSLAGLLDVQAEDNRIEVLRHRLAALPERAELAARQAAIAALDARPRSSPCPATTSSGARSGWRTRWRSCGPRPTSDEASLYSRSGHRVRELQALQDEVTSLRRRAAELRTRSSS